MLINDSDAELLTNVAKKFKVADISGARKMTDEELVHFVSGGNDGDERDTFTWVDVVCEVNRRELVVVVSEAKYDFY